MDSHKAKNTRIVKEIAAGLGFNFCGISKADFLTDEATHLEQWLANGHHGQMHYMTNHYDLRLDPRKLVPGAKSVVSLMYNYYNPKKQENPDAPKVSMYAYGRDYHKVIRHKLKEMLSRLREAIGEVNGRVFVDSAPVMERSWAARSGLGWIGKHTLLINKGSGSWYFLAQLITDLDLEEDGPIKDYCGSCTACIDACPTEAIKPYLVEAEKCISYLTIELKDQIPDQFKGKLDNWAFGCDICQEVCPWNRFARSHTEDSFSPGEVFLRMKPEEWEEMTEEVFNNLFNHTPVKRAGWTKIKKTLVFNKQ